MRSGPFTGYQAAFRDRSGQVGVLPLHGMLRRIVRDGIRAAAGATIRSA